MEYCQVPNSVRQLRCLILTNKLIPWDAPYELPKRILYFMENRAITIKQKREVILRLYRLWKTYPDLRLTQLIGNIKRDPLYYEEDFDFIQSLENGYKRLDVVN